MANSDAPRIQRIERIKDEVYQIYEKIRQSNTSHHENFTVKKVTKVYVRAIKKNLSAFKQMCVDPELKSKIDSLISDVEYMEPDGATKTYIYHNFRGSRSDKIEFICFTITKYKYNNEEVFDYFVWTHSYSDYENDYVVTRGGGLAAGGLFGIVRTLSGIVTDGLAARMVIGVISGIVTAGGLFRIVRALTGTAAGGLAARMVIGVISGIVAADGLSCIVRALTGTVTGGLAARMVIGGGLAEGGLFGIVQALTGTATGGLAARMVIGVISSIAVAGGLFCIVRAVASTARGGRAVRMVLAPVVIAVVGGFLVGEFFCIREVVDYSGTGGLATSMFIAAAIGTILIAIEFCVLTYCTDTGIQTSFKNTLEARFMYGLVRNGYAEIQDRMLRISDGK